jgi:hypothetical protein
MVAIPKKDDVVKTVKVSGQVPKGIMDLVEEQLEIKNKREGNTADLDFCLQFVMKAWGEEMQAENEREAKKAKDSKDGIKPPHLVPQQQSA